MDVESNKSVLPHYRTADVTGWDVEMLGIEAVDPSIYKDYAGVLGFAITDITLEADGIKKARIRNKRGRWLEYKSEYDISNGLGDGTPITGIEIVGEGFSIGVHVKGGSWQPAVKTSNVEGAVVAGTGAVIDAIWIDRS